MALYLQMPISVIVRAIGWYRDERTRLLSTNLLTRRCLWSAVYCWSNWRTISLRVTLSNGHDQGDALLSLSGEIPCKMHSLDSFFDQVIRLSWPRLERIMEGLLTEHGTSGSSQIRRGVWTCRVFVAAFFSVYTVRSRIGMGDDCTLLSKRKSRPQPSAVKPEESISSQGTCCAQDVLDGTVVGSIGLARLAPDCQRCPEHGPERWTEFVAQ